MTRKPDEPDAEQNSPSIETIAGQLVAMQMLQETIIIDGIRSGALSPDLFISAIEQAMDRFPNNKNLSQNELFGAIGTLNSTLEAITVATTGQLPKR